MGLIRRLLSADYRAALAAEAAGDLDIAAERYALAGHRDAAVRVHMARAVRAETRAGEIAALRDALHWADADSEAHRLAARTLGRALLARARAEGIATGRDRARVREAATLLLATGDHAAAGDAWASVGDDDRAAAAYRQGGIIDRLEAILDESSRREDAERQIREAFADYELCLAGGDRDGAVAALERCMAVAPKGTYEKLRNDLEARLITGGAVRFLRAGGDGTLVVIAGSRFVIGRDPLCEVALRQPGISRRHAEITVGPPDTEPRFAIRDLGSRNGTAIDDVAVTGGAPLSGRGQINLGQGCVLEFETVDGGRLKLSGTTGLDRDLRVLAGGDHERLELAAIGVPASLEFRRGRPFLIHDGGALPHVLGDETIARGDIQLIHGDRVSTSGIELEVP